jgi:DNA-binding transcriptional LysR family regulator
MATGVTVALSTVVVTPTSSVPVTCDPVPRDLRHSGFRRPRAGREPYGGVPANVKDIKSMKIRAVGSEAMHLQQLAYVLTVAEEQSFTRAAARLHLAQPSLSRAVRLLEQELGVTLFNRGPGLGPVTLTPDGSSLLPFMQRVVADVEATGAEARALSGMARGRLAVGATPSLVTSVLAPALVEFHASHLGIDLSVVEAGSHQLVPQVAAGEVDLALVVLPVTDPLVVTTPLFDDPLVLAVAPDHPFATRRRVRVRDLDGLDLVMFREGYDLRAVTLEACREAGVVPHLVSEGGEMAGVLSFVAAGLGAAVVPAIALDGDGTLTAVPFTGPTLSRTVALAQRGDRALARPARALAEQLLARHGAGSAATSTTRAPQQT